MHSRRKSREFLLQSLYARATRGGEFERDEFIVSYFSWENKIDLEKSYVDAIETALLAHEKELLSIITGLSLKFELATLPVLHILIIMIALTEMRYAKDLAIPEAVAVNEAIELAKRFSDDGGREFVNGVLSSYIKEPEKQSEEVSDFRVFG
jgi:N utilization substance protein B